MQDNKGQDKGDDAKRELSGVELDQVAGGCVGASIGASIGVYVESIVGQSLSSVFAGSLRGQTQVIGGTIFQSQTAVVSTTNSGVTKSVETLTVS